jgi:flagellar basal-body rod protein FlgF
MSSYGVWLSAAGMKVCEHRQTLHANNLANAQTTGFKSDLAEFRQRPVASMERGGGSRLRHPVLDQLSGGVNVRPSRYDFSQGSIENTGRPLDVAIRGDGFLTVSDGQNKRLTRDGELTLNTTGELVLADGSGEWRVLDQGGTPVRVDRAAGPVSIGGSGLVQQKSQTIAQLRLMTPADPQKLRKIGANLFEHPKEELQPAAGTLVPEAREESNYNAMIGLTAMIEASRAYQMNATLIQLQDAATGQAVSMLGRVA